MKVLHLDTNHPILIEGLNALGFESHENYTDSKETIQKIIHEYEGIIIRSRFPIDKTFLDKATHLKFIGRVGAGLENIDIDHASKKGIKLVAAPEGNRNAVGEHTLGMLLSLFNNFKKANYEINSGSWQREANRGHELDGKTVGLIGYGNMGKAFAKKLKGFETEVIFYDLKPNLSDENAKQVSLKELHSKTDVLSLHTPQTPLTLNMIDDAFIESFSKPFWFINTARGKSVVTADLVKALKSRKILGAGLDVLEYEKASFENLFAEASQVPEALKYLIDAQNVILTPHVAGWTHESKRKLAEVIISKIEKIYR
ncbi:2-hydroxyacid dehydrogenase [Ascidiimonas sp. W6]|uniref:2-hydroxyacid dehydrogenase n=1 Tax=Ascidiimonas meishanensis TaxID=3128903 RepID=UPI0030EBCFD9